MRTITWVFMAGMPSTGSASHSSVTNWRQRRDALRRSGWRLGEEILREHLDYLAPRAARFQVFGGVNWSRWAELGDGFAEFAARRLAVQKGWGARGLKIWKALGLHVRDQHGALVRVDDMRLDPIWETAGSLGLPVMLHIADPLAFFEAIDETNERWEELERHPEWTFTSPPFPPFLDILDDFKRLVLRHPHTTFIGAHVGCYAENLAWVGDLLDQAPNFYVDISARIGELGRQPYSARRFCCVTPTGFSRVDDARRWMAIAWPIASLKATMNTSITVLVKSPSRDAGMFCGVFLPEDVLLKIYRANALRLLNF
jgi:hypothetical protein